MEEKSIEFGSYWFTENEKKPIEWIEIDSDGDRKLLISKYVIELKPFNDERLKRTSWAECSLRKWLNEDFFNEAFTQDEREKICTVKNKNLDNDTGVGIVEGGRSTEDKIFLISKEEFSKLDYEVALGISTPYASNKGLTSVGSKYEWWWTRSVSFSSRACIMYSVNGDCTAGGSAHTETVGVRPVMWVNFGNEKYEYIREEIEYIHLGSYYQENLDKKTPIKWRVLKRFEDRALLVACDALDYQPYDVNSNSNWKECSLRKWLNKEFLNTAFNDEEKKKIKGEITLLDVEQMMNLFDGYEDRADFKITKYVKATGRDSELGFLWLYSDGEYCNPAMMTRGGHLSFTGICGSFPQWIRPAMWIIN